jgi:N4-gp56 family major capsid protein
MGSWEWDAPSGTYQNHALSSAIRMAAVADSQFMRFLTPERGYGKGRGASVTITRMKNLPLAGPVSETDRLPSGTPEVTVFQKAVQEWGFKIEGTQFEADITHFNINDRRQQKLRDQLRLTMDKMAADAFKLTTLRATGTAAGYNGCTFEDATLPADATTATAVVNMDIGHLRAIHDQLAGDKKAPPFRNGKYIGILSTKAARGIKSDPEYKDWQAPSTSEPFITGRLKDVENFMLIETNHYDALDNTIPTATSVTGQAVFFGADAGFLAVVRNPALRVGLTEDLGRFREFGWVGTIEAGNTWGDDSDNSRVCFWSSSA